PVSASFDGSLAPISTPNADVVEAAADEVAAAVTTAKNGAVAKTSSGPVVISTDGTVSLESAEGGSIGMSAAGGPSAVTVEDGAIVQSGVAPSTDLVTRVTDD